MPRRKIHRRFIVCCCNIANKEAAFMVKRPAVGPPDSDPASKAAYESAIQGSLRKMIEELKGRYTKHERRADLLYRMDILFGLPIAILSTVSGTAALATLGEQAGNL